MRRSDRSALARERRGRGASDRSRATGAGGTRPRTSPPNAARASIFPGIAAGPRGGPPSAGASCLLIGDPRILEPAPVEVIDAPVGPGRPDDVRDGLGEGPVAPLVREPEL